MKLLISLLISILLSSKCHSQQLDQSINTIANDLSKKVFNKKRVRLAVTDFVNHEGNVDPLTKYIRDELEIKLINSDQDLQVIDRKHIKLLLSEHHLQSEGLIDETTAKSAIEFIKVDGWVIAEITKIDEQIKIKVSVIDVSTSQIYAASASEAITDKEIKYLLDPKCEVCNGSGFVTIQTICAACKGSGSVMCKQCGGSGTVEMNTWSGHYETCGSCKGKGKFSCGICSGKGKTYSTQICSKCKGSGKL